MIQKKLFKNPINQIGFGFTAFMQTVALSVCFSAVTGQGLICALSCIISCALFSLTSENQVGAPNPLLVVPFVYVCANTSLTGAFLSISVATLISIFLKSKFKSTYVIPDFISAGTSLGLCIGATILLTNSYFGIGATGTTPFEMLRNYRSLGFHPHFMGLLTGTITLFTMITYPFKFKKLSKTLPAPFITIAIPYLLNLFLNPISKYTAINEADFFTPLMSTRIRDSFPSVTGEEIPVIIEGFIIFLWLFTIMNNTPEKKKLQVCNVLSPIPVTDTPIKQYGVLSAVTVIAVSLLCFTLLPQVFARLSLHSAGAMLIVYTWQNVPYKKLATTFKMKEKRFINIVCFLVCVVSFVFLKAYTATLVCALATIVSSPVRKENKNDC